jgi:hypothetical protein
MAPAHPLSNAKAAWDKLAETMDWFTDIVSVSYAWTDGLIKSRQGKVNKAAKIAKAEKEAFRIMMDQAAREKKSGANVRRKRDVVWMGDVFEPAVAEDEFDVEGWLQYLDSLDLE